MSFNYVVEAAMLELKELDTVTQEPMLLKTVDETTVQTENTETQEVIVQIEIVENQETTTHIINVQTQEAATEREVA